MELSQSSTEPTTVALFNLTLPAGSQHNRVVIHLPDCLGNNQTELSFHTVTSEISFEVQLPAESCLDDVRVTTYFDDWMIAY